MSSTPDNPNRYNSPMIQLDQPPPPRLNIGDLAFVSATETAASRDVFSVPGGEQFGLLQYGWVVELRDGPIEVDDAIWWNVYCRMGQIEGWIVEGRAGIYWLEPVAAQSVCADTYPTRLHVGQRAYMSGRQYESLQLRSEPGVATTAIGLLPAGQIVAIRQGPICVDGLVWWLLVADGSVSQVGWSAERDAAGNGLAPLIIQHP